MKYLTAAERNELAGDYFAPEGLYEYTKSLPFLGRVTSNVSTLVAGLWAEILLDYEVGASGLADGAWIEGTFKSYCDWALFQTSDPTKDNYISATYIPNTLHPGQEPATVQSLGIRFDQKGHERPFQKAVIVDIHDGYLNPGDRIQIRLGDRRFGGRGTRVQSSIEKGFKWRFYVDPVGTSRFAPIQPDIEWDIVAGRIHKLQILSPRLLRPDVPFKVHTHAEDIWGNTTINLPNQKAVIEKATPVNENGWTNAIFSDLTIHTGGDYTLEAFLLNTEETILASKKAYLSISSHLPIPKILYGDLHVHSDDTVGTESSSYNFTYGRDIAALDVLGYTANDFQITQERWDSTLSLIKSLNDPGKFVIFPGTEWCGNSAAGGDHNVVFLDEPESNPPEFPLDKQGNVARSFEWSEHGPKDLVPGAWPLDEVYATYAHDPNSHLLIPHVGGRRCNLSWHHPSLERLVEIGSAWGHFEWLLRDALRRGWKLGVCANSDEHRGRCGGGVPGTAVFGTRGGLTGILAEDLSRESVAKTLRARRTFATTGERLVGLVLVEGSNAVQGDEIDVPRDQDLKLNYHFLGERGFSSIEAFDASGLIWSRNFWTEAESANPNVQTNKLIRVTWGGARLYDRYREAIWTGTIKVPDTSSIKCITPFGGLEDNPEDYAHLIDDNTIAFSSKTSGDLDGVNIALAETNSTPPQTIIISGSIDGYVKVGDPLKGNPHKPQPTFSLDVSWDEALRPGGKSIEIAGGAELFVSVEAVPVVELPRGVQGLEGKKSHSRAVYLVGREWSGGKVVSSPVFWRYV
ncbi:uncharacterized protein BDV14DRAFT_207298 [Aspergillus stella-maris]|uniref:uncharacterized protein n=1 Tax=Aspergillus stella-maris TaxID=1810926 RepID=UPI003CCE0EE1